MAGLNFMYRDLPASPNRTRLDALHIPSHEDASGTVLVTRAPPLYFLCLPSIIPSAFIMEIVVPLPLELVLNVITCSLPAAPNAFLQISDPATKLLLVFPLVCQETWRLANRYLR
jgi:hypothetical protein